MQGLMYSQEFKWIFPTPNYEFIQIYSDWSFICFFLFAYIHQQLSLDQLNFKLISSKSSYK